MECVHDPAIKCIYDNEEERDCFKCPIFEALAEDYPH